MGTIYLTRTERKSRMMISVLISIIIDIVKCSGYRICHLSLIRSKQN